MITAILVFVFGVGVYAAANNGEWGTVAVGVVIILLLIGIRSACVHESKAYNNFTDYWANKK